MLAALPTLLLLAVLVDRRERQRSTQRATAGAYGGGDGGCGLHHADSEAAVPAVAAAGDAAAGSQPLSAGGFPAHNLAQQVAQCLDHADLWSSAAHPAHASRAVVAVAKMLAPSSHAFYLSQAVRAAIGGDLRPEGGALSNSSAAHEGKVGLAGLPLSPCMLEFESSAYAFSGTVQWARLRVRRRGPASGVAEVSYCTRSGTGRGVRDSGAEYLDAHGTLVFRRGESVKEITVRPATQICASRRAERVQPFAPAPPSSHPPCHCHVLPRPTSSRRACIVANRCD